MAALSAFIASMAHGVDASASCIAPTALGCFADPYTDPTGTVHPVLTHVVTDADPSMTVIKCVAMCCAAGFGVGSIAGVERGDACYCDTGFGPYTVPPSNGCNSTCAGDAHAKCGGTHALDAFSITSCPNTARQWPSARSTLAAPPATQRCGAGGCTACPTEDACCTGVSPDAYRVAGGYGCSPPNVTASGCGYSSVKASNRCCCAPGPAASTINASLANVLLVGDSVSMGYTRFVRAAFRGVATIGHGPDNTGGGAADGVAYGSACAKYFVRTPQHALPPWDVITFNFGLHDGSDTNASYLAGITAIADELVDVAKVAKPVGAARTQLVYFATTHSDGGVVPGEPVSASNKRVKELNAIAARVMAQRAIPVVDLFKTMDECGAPCAACKPHCGAAGYKYLVTHAIVPAIEKALRARARE